MLNVSFPCVNLHLLPVSLRVKDKALAWHPRAWGLCPAYLVSPARPLLGGHAPVTQKLPPLHHTCQIPSGLRASVDVATSPWDPFSLVTLGSQL